MAPFWFTQITQITRYCTFFVGPFPLIAAQGL